MRLVGIRRRWLVIVPFRPKQPPKETPLLLLLLIGIGRHCPRLGWSCRCLRTHGRRRQRRQPDRSRSDRSLLADAKNLLEHIPLIAGSLIARLGRRRSVKKGNVVVCGATRVSKQISDLIQPHDRDSRGHRELARVRVLRQLDSVLHEPGPQWYSGLGSVQL